VHAHSRRVVFIIDADDSSRVTHETILRSEGYDLLSSADGARALPLVREQIPDLILLGSRTGTMSVLKLIQLIKSDQTTTDIKLIGFADGPELSVDALVRAGVDEAVPTRCAAQELVRCVVALIGRA
jgi:CheY-like chemotaxis protein